MSTPTGTSRLAAAMDGLVADARWSRDQVVNTVDAADRRARLASESLARQVQRFCAERAAHLRAERSATGLPDADGAVVADRAGAPAAEDDDDGYPETWLR